MRSHLSDLALCDSLYSHCEVIFIMDTLLDRAIQAISKGALVRSIPFLPGTVSVRIKASFPETSNPSVLKFFDWIKSSNHIPAEDHPEIAQDKLNREE